MPVRPSIGAVIVVYPKLRARRVDLRLVLPHLCLELGHLRRAVSACWAEV